MIRNTRITNKVMSPKSILFDLGGTVLEERSYDLDSGFATIAPQLLYGADVNKFVRDMNMSREPLSEFSALDWLTRHVDVTVDQRGDAVHELEWRLWKSTVHLLPQPDVVNALEKISATGVRIAAITNTVFSAACVTKELALHGLLDYFEFVLSSADFRLKKPHPKIFQAALDRLEVSAEDAVYIGDNLHADIEGSVAAGMTPVWFGETANSKQYMTLKQWSELEVQALLVH